MPSPSLSVCAGFAVVGQLSQVSATRSPSLSVLSVQKLAVRDRAEVTVTIRGLAVELTSPVQPVKKLPLAVWASRVREVPVK